MVERLWLSAVIGGARGCVWGKRVRSVANWDYFSLALMSKILAAKIDMFIEGVQNQMACGLKFLFC